MTDLGFIKIRDGQAGPFAHALIMPPYLVLKKMHEDGEPGLSREKYRGLEDRAHEITATDLDDDYLDDDEDDDEESKVPALASEPGPAAKASPPKKPVTRKLPIKPKPI